MGGVRQLHALSFAAGRELVTPRGPRHVTF